MRSFSILDDTLLRRDNPSTAHLSAPHRRITARIVVGLAAATLAHTDDVLRVGGSIESSSGYFSNKVREISGCPMCMPIQEEVTR